MSEAPLVLAQNIVVALGARQVLRGSSLALHPGRLAIVVGRNGAGKSTLLRALAGLLPLTSGKVAIAGRSVAEIDRRERARLIAYLPQISSLAWRMSVHDLVMLGRLPHGATLERHGAADRRAVEAALAAVALTDFAKRDVLTLSGGERGRAFLARALATEARLLLCDEPLANLDPAYQLAAIETLRATARAGAAVVAVMHDLGMALRFADHLIVLNDGKVIAEGKPAEIVDEALIAHVFAVRAELVREGEGLRLIALHAR